MRNFSKDYQTCNVSSHLLKVREIDVVNILEKEMRGHICSALPSHLYFAFTYVASVGEPVGPYVGAHSSRLFLSQLQPCRSHESFTRWGKSGC